MTPETPATPKGRDMNEHTKTPWEWGENWDIADRDGIPGEQKGGKYLDLQLYGADGTEIIPIRVDHYEPIWDVSDEPGQVQPTKADREFLVRAVNCHEELVKVCEKVVAWLDRLTAHADEQAKARFMSLSEACKADAKNYRATAASIRAALSKAKEQPQ